MTPPARPALLTLASLALAGTPAASPLLPQLEKGEPVRIVCFGDSITGAYYHTGGHRTWCDLLGIALRRLYPAVQAGLVNAGRSGETTADALRRLDPDVLQRHPQLVVVMFGMNDAAKLPLETYRANLGEIIRRTRAAGAEIMLLTPTVPDSGDAGRPPERIARFAAIVREVGREQAVAVADVHGAFAAVQAGDAAAWRRLMSDTIHPNLRGHALIAETAAQVLTGRSVSLLPLPPPAIGLPRVRARLQAGAPLHVLAMPPYDRLIAPALQRLHPGAEVRVTVWETAGQSLVGLEAGANGYGWAKYHAQPGLTPPDLVVLAVPPEARAGSEAEYYRRYAGLLNAAQSFAQPGWDCLVLLPSVARPGLDGAERAAEQWARAATEDKDLAWIAREPGESGPAAAILAQRLAALLAAP